MPGAQVLKIFQKGFNYSQDGRGNRLILHLQGCNMRCPWCSNPEGLSLSGTLMTDPKYLTEHSCPKGAVSGGVLNRSLCGACKERPCIQGRRQKGIRLSCTSYTVEELLEECSGAVPMFFDGGGVTLTGGEISMQFEGVTALLKGLGALKIHRAIECNATHPRMSEWIPLVDQWIMDVKHYDDARHQKWTGVSNRQVIANLKQVGCVHPDLLVRVPLIPGFNDQPEDAAGFASLFSEALRPANAAVEFLTYHEFGKAKWARCGLTYQMPSAKIQEGTVELFEEALKAAGIRCVRT